MYYKNCTNCLVRHRQTRIVFYCKINKRYIIPLSDCENCLDRNLVRNKGIRKVSTKRMKLEKERDNKLIKKGKCEYCKKECEHLDAHEIYGGSNRKRSIENGFVVLLCRECHQNEEIIQELRKQYQIRYEKEHTREEFIKLIGKNYL